MNFHSLGQVIFEEGIDKKTIQDLKLMGHNVLEQPLMGDERQLFGRGQIIRRNAQTGVLWACSDPRGMDINERNFPLNIFFKGDGLAIGW